MRGLLRAGISGLFLSSLLFASTFLNGNVLIKQFGVKILISVFSVSYCFFLFKRITEIKLGIIDLLIIVFLLFYGDALVFFNHNIVNYAFPFYYGLLYFMVRTFDSMESKILRIIPIIIFTHAIIVIFQQIGLLPPFHGYFNNGSTFGNPDMLGTYIAVLLPFCFLQKDGWKKIGYFAFLTGILLLIFIQARSALFATLLSGLLWIILNKHGSIKSIIVVSFLVAVCLFVLIQWRPESVYGRFFVWFISSKMLMEKPLGWGMLAFEKYYPEFQASYLAVNRDLPDVINPDVVHSPFDEFLNTGVTLGIIGLLLLITLVVLIFYAGIKSKSPLIYPLFIFFVISLFYFPFKIAPLVALIVSMVAVVSNKSQIIYQIQFSLYAKRLFFFMLFLFSLLLTVNSFSNYQNYKKWQNAVLYFNNENLAKSEKLFLELYPVMKEDGRFLITYSNLKYRQGSKEQALKLLEEAGSFFCDITMSLKLAKLYEELGFYEQAEKKYDLAINIAPNNFTAAYEKILFLQNIGEYEKAYRASIQLVNKPIRDSVYADPVIMKLKLKRLIRNYENNLKE